MTTIGDATSLVVLQQLAELSDYLTVNDQISKIGFSVIRDILPHAVLAESHQICLQEWHRFGASDRTWFGGGSILGHVNYRPAKTLPVLRTILEDEHLLANITAILGSGSALLAIGGNVNMPGSRYQPIHTDGVYDSRFIAMGIPLGDVSEKNGSIEVFPGTHSTPMTLKTFQEKYVGQPGHRINTVSGDVILRYPNVWHRATPNWTEAPRFMLSLLFGPGDWLTSQTHNAPSSLLDLPKIEGDSRCIALAKLPDDTGEFFANYFATTASGYCKEVICRYFPRLYESLRLRASE